MAVANETRQMMDKLTDSDLELVKQLCLPDKIIAENLGVSHLVIRQRITRICIKFGVENRRAVIVRALELDLISLDQFVYRDYGKPDIS